MVEAGPPPPPQGFDLVQDNVPPPPAGFELAETPVNSEVATGNEYAPPSRRVGVMDVVRSAGRDIVKAIKAIPGIPQHAGEASEEWRLGERTAANAGAVGESSMMGGLKLNKLPVTGRTSGVTPYGVGDKPAIPVAEVGANPVVPPKPVTPSETIRGAAVKFGDQVVEGPTHFDVLKTEAQRRGVDVMDVLGESNAGTAIDGFVTNTGRFVDRVEADAIARAADQVQAPKGRKADGLGANELKSPIEQVLSQPDVPPPPPGFVVDPVRGPAASPLGAAATTTTPTGNAPLPPSYPQAVSTVRSRIGTPPKESPFPKDLVAEVVDDLNPVLRAETAVGRRPQDFDPTTSPYQAMRLTRGAGGKVEQFLQHGTFDFNTLGNKGGSFVDAVKPIAKVKDEFKAYLLAKRDLELEARGIDTGIDSAASQVVARNAPTPIKQAAQRLYKYQDDVLQYAEDAGLLTPQATADMRAANWAYIPFYRVMDEGRTAPFTSRGMQTGRPTSAIKGSERQIVDPLDSVIRNTQTFIQKAEHNRALKVLEDFSAQHPDLGILKPYQKPVRPIEVQPSEIARIVDDLNIPPNVANLVGNETFAIFRKSDKALPDNVVEIFHDGKPRLYEMDPEIARAVKGMDNVDMGNFLRIIGAPSRMLRAGVVLDPTYMARNMVRDQFSATMQSANNYYPVLDFARGLASRVRQGDVYQNWLKSGGALSSLQGLDRTSAAVKLASKYGQDPTLGGKVKNVVTKPLDVLRLMSQVVDEATRIGEFKNVTKGATDAQTIQKGGFQSRELTTDFSKRGRDPTIRALSQISEFMNAQIQGTAREAQAVRRQPGKTAAVTAAAITLPSVYLWIQNHDDPRYKHAPRWEKDAFWMIMPADPKQEPWRIPKPWVFGMLGGSAVERSLDKFVDSKPEAFKDFGSNLAKAMLPNYIPTVAKPVIEQFSNRSLFMDRPIEAERLKNLPPSERYTETTPELYKKAGKGVAAIAGEVGLASPQMLQNYVRAWGGTLGQNAVLLADKGVAATGATKAPPAPLRGLTDLPVIRAFVSQYPSANAQPISDFYEKNTEIEQKVNAMKQSRRRGDESTSKTYEEQIETRTQGFKRQLDQAHREVRRIRLDPEMKPAEKTEQIKQKYLEMLDTAQRGLQVIRNAEAARLQRKQAPEYKGP